MRGLRLRPIDYQQCGEAKNLDWPDGDLPATRKTPTRWRCRQCDSVFMSSYEQVKTYCYPCTVCRITHHRLPAEAYHAAAAARGFEWLGRTVPKTTETPTDWRCSQGHVWSTTYRAVKGGTTCLHCVGLARKTEDDYRAFAERGIFWIGEELPRTTNEPTRWRCDEGHEWTTRYATIYLGSSCPHCKDKQRKRTFDRYTEADYHQMAEQRGFEWIGDVLPVNSKQPTSWRCAAGHEWQTCFGELYKGRGCPYCSGVGRKREVDYQALADQHNIEWIAGSLPKTAMTPTPWRCAEGHTFQASYERIKERVVACPECRVPRMYGNCDYQALAETHGWKWIGKTLPPNICTVTDWQCSQGHTWKMSYSWVAEKGTCPVCSGRAR